MRRVSKVVTRTELTAIVMDITERLSNLEREVAKLGKKPSKGKT